MSNDEFEIKKEIFLADPCAQNALKYGKALFKMHLNEDAIKILSTIEDEEFRYDAIYYCAQAYCYMGNLDEAATLYKKLIGNKHEGFALYELSQIYIRKIKMLKNKKENKEELFRLKEIVYDYLNKAIQKKPTYKAYLCLATQQMLEHKMDEALKNCQIILSHQEWFEKNINKCYLVKLKIAEINYHLNNLEEAKKVLDELLNVDYENKNQIYKIYGLIYVKEGNLSEAQNALKNINEDIIAYDLYFAYAKLCAEQQCFDEAINYLKKCDDSYLKYQSYHQLGKIYTKLGYFDKAINTYSLMLNGSNVDKNIGTLGIAICERKTNNFENALLVLENIKNPNLQDESEVLLEKYKIFSFLGKKDEAKEALDKLIKLDYNGYGLFEYAKIKIKNREIPEAISLFEKIIQSNGAYKWLAYVYIGKIYKYIGNFIKASEYFNNVPETFLDAFYEALGELIEIALEEKDVSKAEGYLLKFENAKKLKDLENYYYYSGLIAYFKGEYEYAISFFEKITLKEIRDYAITELVKIYWLKYNEIGKAKRYLNELISSENINSKAQGYFLYGHMNFISGNYEEAKKYLNYNVVNDNHRKDDSLSLIASCEENSNNYDGALNIYLSLLKNNDVINLFKLGNLYIKMNNYKEAKKIFNNLVLENKFIKTESLLKLAIIEYKEKNYVQSLNYLNDLHNTNLEYHAKIWEAKVLKGLNKYKEAEIILKELLNTENRNYALLELAILEYERNILNAALNYINILINESVNHDQIYGYYHKGKIYQKAGLLEDAKECFLKILSMDTSNRTKTSDNNNFNDIRFDINKNSILLELGSLEENKGNYEEAEKYYTMIEKSSHIWKFAMKSLSYIKGLQNDFDEANRIIYDLEKDLFDDYALLAKGKLLILQGLYEDARINLEKVSLDNRVEALYLISQISLQEGDLEKAKLLFKQITLLSDKDSYYVDQYLKKISVISKKDNDRDIYEKYKNRYPESLLKLIYLNIFENRFDEALIDALKLYEIIEYREEAITILYYLSKELNVILDRKYYGALSYIRNQILDYDRTFVEQHIKNNKKKPFDDLFNPDIDINLILDMIQPFLNDENYVFSNFFDTYVIFFENIGINGENYLAVQTLPKSKNVITMYPVKKKFKIEKFADEKTLSLTKTIL